MSFKRHRRPACAFTLVELLIVIAIIGILAALLLPVLIKAKKRAQGVYCLNNGRQLMMAVSLYSSDYHDWLPPNDQDFRSWVVGDMSSLDATNMAYLVDPQYAKLIAYTGPQPGIYKCPGDRSIWTDYSSYPYHQFPTLRTYTMNGAVGTKTDKLQAVDGIFLFADGTHRANHPWRTYGRTIDMTDPAPVNLFVLAENAETPDHISTVVDGNFDVVMQMQPTIMGDRPATRHNFSGMLAFADGHGELHKWTDSRTSVFVWPPPTQAPIRQGDPDNPDVLWLQQRASARAEGQ